MTIHFAARIETSHAWVYTSLCGTVSLNWKMFINWKNVNAATKKESGEWRITCAECIRKIGAKTT